MRILLDLNKKFKEKNIPYCLVGGLAVALHGYTRATMDIDIIINISEKNFVLCEQALKELGFVSRLPVTGKEIAQFRKEYIEKRNLTAWSFYHQKNSMEVIDIVLTYDQKKVKYLNFELFGEKIPVISKPDLIKMKELAGRPQDLLDIAQLSKKES